MHQEEQLWRCFFPQFIESEDPELKTLVENAKLIELPGGKTLFYPGAPCQNYVLVVDGQIRVHLVSRNGREILLYRVKPGDSCILTTSCLLGKKPYPAEGTTEEPVTAFVIDQPTFRKTLERSQFFRSFVFENFSARLSTVITRMEEVVFEAVERRLAKVLLENPLETLEKTHQELAAELGTAREVVSRHLKRFERYGWIKMQRGSIWILDAKALQRVTEFE